MTTAAAVLIRHTDPDALRARVLAGARDLASGRHLYVLVEPGMLDDCASPVPAGLARHFREPGDTSLYARRHEVVAASFGPMLAQPEPVQAEWLWDIGQRHHAVSWLWTEQPIEQAAQRLARWLDAKTDDGLDFLLRFYDPRLAEPMLTLMGPDVLQGLLLPGEQWAWVDPWQRACTLDPVGARHNAPAAAAPWTLTPDQTEAVMLLCGPGPLLDALTQRMPGLLARWARPTPYALACHLSRVAAAHGLSGFERQFCYALDALDIHPLVHQSPVIQAQLQRGVALDVALASLAPVQRTALAEEWARADGPGGFTAPLGYANQPLAVSAPAQARVA